MTEGTIGWARPELLSIGENRQRQLHRADAHEDLVTSIRENGLINPLVVDVNAKQQMVLVAGERRLRACKEILAAGGEIRLVNGQHEAGCIPVIVLHEQSEVVRRRIELAENIHRLDITWQERARAVAALTEMLRLDRPDITNAEIADRAGVSDRMIATKLILAENMALPGVAGATTELEAKKQITKHFENVLKQQIALEQLRSELESPNAPASRHTLLQGDAAVVLAGLETKFDVILTDPPYGVGADKFSHKGTLDNKHLYSDSNSYLQSLIKFLPGVLTGAAKEKCHLYLFCDVQNWLAWRTAFEGLGWEVCNRPLIWSKGRGPVGSADVWPAHTYESILYAVRGRKPTMGTVAADVLTYPPVQNRMHAAQKPVELYVDLLRRSTLLNDSVLDCFCGSGTIFEAADKVSCKATGIDLEIGTAQRRLAGEREGGRDE